MHWKCCKTDGGAYKNSVDYYVDNMINSDKGNPNKILESIDQ